MELNRKRPLAMLNYEDDMWDNDETYLSPYTIPTVYAHKWSSCSTPDTSLLRSAVSQAQIMPVDTLLTNAPYPSENNSMRTHLISLEPRTDDGCQKSLAGLIFMSNDRVRRSCLKYGVLGLPLSRKHVLDRVNAATKLFLFEFEARVLWGIYEAISEYSIDIEKDAYREAEIPIPAQVKFRVVKHCKPLPEMLFQSAISDNYFTPKKFNFELTEAQVANLTLLFKLQEMDSLVTNGRVIGATESRLSAIISGRNTLTTGGAQDMPYLKMLNPTPKPGGEGLVSKGYVADLVSCQCPEHVDLHVMNCPFKYKKGYQNDLEGMIPSDSLAAGCSSRCILHAGGYSASTSHAKNVDSPGEDDLRHHLYQSKLLRRRGNHLVDSELPLNTSFESSKQRPKARSTHPLSLAGTVVTSSEHILNDESYLYKRHLHNQLPFEELASAVVEYPGNDTTAFPRLRTGVSSRDDALWDKDLATKQVVRPCSRASKPTPTQMVHPVEACVGYSISDSDLQQWRMQGLLQPIQDGRIMRAQTRNTTATNSLTDPSKAWAKYDELNTSAEVSQACVCSGMPSKGTRLGNLNDISNYTARKCGQHNAVNQVGSTSGFPITKARQGLLDATQAGMDNDNCAITSLILETDETLLSETWLEKARQRVLKSVMRQNDGECFDNNLRQSSILEEQNQLPPLFPVSSEEQPSLTIAGEHGYTRSSHSVWSRLSNVTRTVHTRQTTRETVCSGIESDELQVPIVHSSRKKGLLTTSTCLTQFTSHGIEDELDMDECFELVETEVKVAFKRRKHSPQAEEQMKASEHDVKNHTERRKIRRPSIT